MMKWIARAVIIAAVAGLALSGQMQQGNAAFPGNNGKILFNGNRDGGNHEFYAMNPDGSDQTNLTNSEAEESRGSWSPDGFRIVFSRNAVGYNEIFVMNADGSNIVQLTSITGGGVGWQDYSPSWSPDGTRITFSRWYSDSSQSDIFVMNADGSALTNLTNTPANEDNPKWSPDGTRIAYTRERPGPYDIWMMNADGSNAVNLTGAFSGDQGGPDWSPDGSKILFDSNLGADRDIYVMNPNGSGVTNLTNAPGNDYFPAWSPDGKEIVFGSNRDGNVEIYVMNADGTNQEDVSNSPGDDWGPDWQPLPVKAGDADCDGDVDAVDALQVLRRVAGLSSTGCVLRANVKCDDSLDAVDALQVLRSVAGLSVNLPGNCVAIGS
ncbi:MAG TPA: hypothetical protein VLS25_12685 [Dehalococcoidia bacterium]|nr:hypothetical protein [Dehalococcoidia bacterium]